MNPKYLLNNFSLIKFCLLWLILMVLDVPFYLYWFVCFIFLCVKLETSLTNKSIFKRLFLFTLIFVISFGIYLILSTNFEILNGNNYKYDFDKLNKSSYFYRIYDIKINYNYEIKQIQNRIDKTHDIIDFLVENINVWSSDTLRYEFIINYWKYSHQFTSQFLCIIESDIVLKTSYFYTKLNEIKPNIAYVQHFWGHEVYEPYNIGILCASKNVSFVNRQIVKIIYLLHNKRYRRFLILPLLYWFISNNYEFNWDKDKGCSNYYTHCNYIHFTRPKYKGIKDAYDSLKTNSSILM